jgi:beta-mannosidase
LARVTSDKPSATFTLIPNNTDFKMNSLQGFNNGFSRRQFLATSTAAAAALCIGGSFLPQRARAAISNRRGLSLNGKWEAAKTGTADWIPAEVPGCIHTDLLAAGKIPDPFYRDNEKQVQWVGESDWLYRRSFDVNAELLAHKQVLLRCEGLDTLATIRINGKEVGRANNMFRTWEFDVKPLLKSGSNQIEIQFDSAVTFVDAMEKKRKENKGVTGRAWLRKQPCQFGWDWAPTLITSGIWRGIGLESIDDARLDDVLILQNHSSNRVNLTIQVKALAVADTPLHAVVTVTHGEALIKNKFKLQKDEGSAELTLKNPKLWWPAGMGAQPLYDVRVELQDDNGKSLDMTTKRIGLRTLVALEPNENKPLRFAVNGVEFFAKGANWIPSDAFSTRVTPERLRQYVADAVAVNMNMLRFWGGGYYEEDALYDACDEMGICVWADFKFACASYPAFDAQFMDNVRREARDNLKRLRHHPCIAVWCGNNEISLLVKDDWSEFSMGRDGYNNLFKKLLADEVKTCAPQTSYVSGSPDCGDVHYWDVWWGARTFEAYRELSGFMSEFGYQSFPEPRTVDCYTSADDRTSTMTDIMKWHQRCPLGNDRIKNMTGNYFRAGKDFDSTVWISQLVQSYGIKLGAEYWRQHMPKSMGCLFWQYNDCWPVASWSSVDYYGRWKALHYAARHFYASVMVSGLENTKTGTVDVFVTSDLRSSQSGTLEWSVTDLNGKVLDDGSVAVEIPPQISKVARTLNLQALCQTYGEKNLLVWLTLLNGKDELSRNMVSFARPKDMNLADPQMTTEVSEIESGFRVKLSAQKPALWAWLSLPVDARYSDNFIHLDSHTSVEIDVTPAKPLSRSEFENALSVRSLFDTYDQELLSSKR